ncbi:MAG: type II toxin-antitoxin system RelE/ParE family toxin [Flavobacteriales bacterium]|nr:type II toxin-antitoxin system RelE/ParE family toxin [Flavobacteriales bacterium]MCB9449062.1 type II toxin-antitoxin system RelE/ParE family toxin [Flavobacteriales bacterium]
MKPDLQPKFQVVFMEEAAMFLEKLPPKTRKKIIYNIRKAQVTRDEVLFKKLTPDVWEFRTLFGKTHYRLFAFWDKTKKRETLVVATHGLIKKTGKTPEQDLIKTRNSMQVYFQSKVHPS